MRLTTQSSDSAINRHAYKIYIEKDIEQEFLKVCFVADCIQKTHGSAQSMWSQKGWVQATRTEQLYMNGYT